MIFIFILTFLLFLVYAGLIIYYRKSWKEISNIEFANGEWRNGEFANSEWRMGKQADSDFGDKCRITVIVPARNEENNIGACLDSIISQSYPSGLFEILVVDDFSTDNTAQIVLEKKAKNIKLISLKNFIAEGAINSYKKKAIEIAIGQSSGELIVCTDADCIVPQNWLLTIAKFLEERKPDFIVMPVSIKLAFSGKGFFTRLIQIFQALDFMVLQGITGASVNKKFHSMCNGANLAYTKKAFNDVNGFKGIDNIASGDDMLLMHKIYEQNPDGVLFLKSKDVIVQTQAVNNLGEFLNQRIRWASKADKYDDKRIFYVLLVVYIFNCLLLLLPVLSIVNGEWSMVNGVVVCGQWSVVCRLSSVVCRPLTAFWLLLFLKTLVEIVFLFPVAKFFSATRLLWWFPFMQPLHIVYTVVAGWLGKFGKYRWKGREVK